MPAPPIVARFSPHDSDRSQEKAYQHEIQRQQHRSHGLAAVGGEKHAQVIELQQRRRLHPGEMADILGVNQPEDRNRERHEDDSCD